jgi:hypothetical protein
MTKAQTAGLGFRVKSGWAAVVVLTDTAHSLHLSDVSRIVEFGKRSGWPTVLASSNENSPGYGR